MYQSYTFDLLSNHPTRGNLLPCFVALLSTQPWLNITTFTLFAFLFLLYFFHYYSPAPDTKLS